MALFFTSDTHFGHKNIINLCQRPFADVLSMNAAIIRDWNRVVTPNDDVWMLGDFSWDRKPAQFFNLLNGNKHLIYGNHDPRETRTLPWVTQHQYIDLTVLGERNIVLFHYPITDWDRRHHGSWHLFGHVHGKPQPKHEGAKCLDVGVDNTSKMPCMRENPWAPISFTQLKAHFENV
jgi:calcineurin-like phosphoesterase family protein